MKHHFSLRRALASVLLAILSIATLAGASNLPLPSREEMSSISAGDLKKHLSFLASDELGGRFTLSPSSRIAARYLASQLESYGYKGAARDGSFFQKVPLQYSNPDTANSRVTFHSGSEKLEFKFGDGFISTGGMNADISGSLVFAGYGIASPKNRHDDYAGLAVKGKIVILVDGVPDNLVNVTIPPEERDLDAALAHGAIGVITILSAPAMMQWNEVKLYMTRGDQLGLPSRATQSGKIMPSITAGPDLVKAIAKAMGKDTAYLMTLGKPLQPTALTATAEIRTKSTVKEAPPAQNVTGILEGSDPKLKDQYIVFSAHYDHLKTSDNGEVYNGADDDGSGTVSVLEIAQAFAVGPRPKRSILIIFHTGEELGLFGSEFNTDYEPVVPLEKLVADFNIDMVGRTRSASDTDPRDRELTDKDGLYVIGADKHSTELNRLSEETNSETARMKFDYRYNDENDPERFYYRSDHYNYAKHGVPIIFYFTGVHRDYHRTTDDVDKIDFEKMERITRMIFALGWRVANLDHRIVVDKKPSNATPPQ
ncbi:MAG: M28 family peptidase [Blastocatellia bacterium]